MKWYISGLLGVFLLFPRPGLAVNEGSSVRTVDLAGHEERSFIPFPGFSGGLSVATGDLGTDEVAEIVIGGGAGMEPIVGIFRQDGSKISEFLAYEEMFTRGVNVAVCDVDGDGVNEIVTGTGFGGGPHIRIFTATGVVKFPGFFAYDTTFRGGVNLACGDINNDEHADIVTGAGITGGPHLKVFSPNGSLTYETFNGSATENTGVSIALADVDGDGDKEILASRAGYGDKAVSIFDLRQDKLSLHTFIPSTTATSNPPIFAFDADDDGHDDIGYGSDTTLLRAKNIQGSSLANISFATSTPGRLMTATRLQSANSDKLLIYQANSAVSQHTEAQYILVDISEQKLTAYAYGIPVKEFLISGGTKYYPSPLGVTTVTDKLLWHDYSWYFGAGDPRNYSLPNVQYNLRFKKGYYIHSAYWHNNFGTPMSHGCINASLADAEWIYNWANVGATVEVTE